MVAVDKIDQVLLLAFIMVPGLVFYWSLYASLGHPFGDRKVYDIITLSAIGGTLSLLPWAALPIDALALDALYQRIVSRPNIVQGLIGWPVLLHYLGILTGAFILGFAHARFLLFISRQSEYSLWRRAFERFGPGYRHYVRSIQDQRQHPSPPPKSRRNKRRRSKH